MPVIQAVFENGVIRPREPIDLPEASELEVEFRVVVGAESPGDDLDGMYEILSRRHRSGEHDVAERHDEHQP
jgi:predicted DNA-binding antitoxin AbrB/MazE fold protein